MDILGSIALCTEPYVEGRPQTSGGEPKRDKDGKIIDEDGDDPSTKKRISRRDALIDKVMWRNISTQALYQITVMLVMIFAGPFMFYDSCEYPLEYTSLKEADNGGLQLLDESGERINYMCTYNPLHAADVFPYGGDEKEERIDDYAAFMTEKDDRRRTNTFVFNTFMFMSYANMINSRSVREKDLNIFKNGLRHPLFWVMLALMALIHLAML